MGSPSGYAAPQTDTASGRATERQTLGRAAYCQF